MNTRIDSIARHDAGLLMVRSILGVAFFFHGAQKLFGAFGGSGLEGFASYLAGLGAPLPSVSAGLAAASEFAGALILITGRGWIGLAPLVFTMVVAAATSARHGFDVVRGGAEYPLVLGVILVALLVMGPGSLVARLPAAHRREVAR